MNCDEYRDLFDAYVDRELSPPRVDELFAHLGRCVRCHLEYKVFTRMVEGVERLDESDAPADLGTAVMDEVQRSEVSWSAPARGGGGRRGLALWGWSLAFAGAFMLFLGTFGGSRQPRQAVLPPAPLGIDREFPPVMVPDAPRAASPEGVGTLLAGRGSAARALPDSELVLVRHGGEVLVMEVGQSAWTAVDETARLNFGDRVQTGPDAEAGLEFPGEVALRLKPGSLLQVVSGSELRLFAGSTWVMVRRKGRAFSVETPNAVASVRGTKYAVETSSLADPYRKTLLETLVTNSKDAGPGSWWPGLPAAAGLAYLRNVRSMVLLSTLWTRVQVYESSVWTSARDTDGRLRSPAIVSEGFGVQVALGRVDEPRLLTQNDFLDWRRVMIFDPGVLERARQSLQLPGTTGTGTVSSEPVSVSGPGEGSVEDFDDLSRTH